MHANGTLSRRLEPVGLGRSLRSFRWKGQRTRAESLRTGAHGSAILVPRLTNEFWTSRQRQAHSLHEVSYRACFKPQLPRFFIERLTRPGDRVYDPFMGRGTTLLEAGLLGRQPMGNDVNPLSGILVAPRLDPPGLQQVEARLQAIDLSRPVRAPGELRVFYHTDTLREIGALRAYLRRRERAGLLDAVDRWIRMVAVNRLTGHSPGFFSVYTLPPNQAVSAASQRRINAARRQTPPRRDVRRLILAKTRSLLADCDAPTRAALAAAGPPLLLAEDAARTPEIADASVDLVVTSPPFLDVVDYKTDNWLRCWFCGIDPRRVAITHARRLEDWQAALRGVFAELRRVLRAGGHVAFEVGEVRGGRLKLEEAVLPVAAGAGLQPVLVLVNDQHFTKTANCWGVTNRTKGTNTNRVVVLRRPAR